MADGSCEYSLRIRIGRLVAERIELVKAAQTLLNQFEKWEGYHQWDEEDENAAEACRVAIAKAQPS